MATNDSTTSNKPYLIGALNEWIYFSARFSAQAFVIYFQSMLYWQSTPRKMVEA